MDKKFSDLNVFDKNNKKFFVFSNINLIFGYAKSGKTTALSKLSDIFSGKDKHYLVNGTQTMPNDYNIIFVGSSEGLQSHLKLNSRSLVKKLIEITSFSKDFQTASENIQKNIQYAKDELQTLMSEILPGSSIKFDNEDSPIDLLLDNISIDMTSYSESSSKWNLFSLADSLSSKTDTRTLIFFDDFNKEFDEEMTIAFFERVRKSNATFFLTTRSVFPQSLISETDSLFAVRDDELHQIPSFGKLADIATKDTKERRSYEEYMIESWNKNNEAARSLFIEKIKNDKNLNILRILTSKSPVINCKPIGGKVTIIPSCKEEETIYKDLMDSLSLKE